ncbi:MAG: hypothetical protein C4523_11925 [Myxococcales bacterium]|nr:MAG: hypothetical protein C4523_11925 [Myxococcales bacterium]
MTDNPFRFDSLTHVTPDGRWFHTAHDAGEARLLCEMDEAGVARAVVVALAGHIENDFVLSLCARHPDRLAPGASFNPAAYANPAAARQGLAALLASAAFPALKLHPRLNRYDPLDPRALAALDELAACPRPPAVWLDTLFYYRGGALSKPVVDTIHTLVCKYPALTFVLLHGGGSWLLQTAEAIRDCENAYLDLSLTLPRYRHASLAADARALVGLFDRRLLFGSDFPEYGIGEAQRIFAELTAGLPEEKLANVLGRNLARLLDSRTA